MIGIWWPLEKSIEKWIRLQWTEIQEQWKVDLEAVTKILSSVKDVLAESSVFPPSCFINFDFLYLLIKVCLLLNFSPLPSH